ncbi:MAG: rod shape-determining protein MreD [Candidatus Omnitrophica bacterium]|nr:rod shape-determining protein MreD [Candidatus Omnitrophota bacterium]
MPRIFSGKVILYLIILVALDMSLRPMIRLWDAGPIFIYLMIPYAVFQWERSRALTLAAFIGVFRDLTGTHPLGLETIVLVLFTFLFDLLAQKVERNFNFIRVAGTFLFVFCVLTVLAVAACFFGGDAAFGYPAGVVFVTAFYTGCLAPLFFNLTARWFHDRLPLKQYELFG